MRRIQTNDEDKERIVLLLQSRRFSRPELNRPITDADKRRFDAVCLWTFDRFARSVSHLLRELETFKALRIEFVSFSEQMDTSTPTGKMVYPTANGFEAIHEQDLQ